MTTITTTESPVIQLNEINFNGIPYRQFGKNIVQVQSEPATVSGVVHLQNGMEMRFSCPLTSDERKALREITGAISKRVIESLHPSPNTELFDSIELAKSTVQL